MRPVPSVTAEAEAAFGPEMRALVCCARRELSSTDRARLRALIHAGLDWDRLSWLAERHRMLPLAWSHLQWEHESIPPTSARVLQVAFMANAGRMLRISADLLELSALFASHEIAMVPYKGPALGAQLYGSLALRQAGDLDLLVSREDVPRARALLLERGYHPRHVLSRGGAAFMSRSRYSEELDHPEHASVELHWAFTNGDIALPLTLAELAPRLRTAQLGNGKVTAFGAEDLLLILCVHGCKHRWDRLEWICGVAEAVRTGAADIDWSALVERASALGVRRMLLLGLLLADDLLGAAAPDEVMRRARSDPVIPKLASVVPTLLSADVVVPDVGGSLTTDVFRFQLRERARDRARFLWYRLTTPSRPESWSAVAVGQRWVPTHGFVRPFRVVGKVFSALWQIRRTGRVRA